MAERRWVKRPEGSNWGDFGDDDQIGRLNLITAERRLAAIREVQTGEVYCLSLPLNLPAGNGPLSYRKPPQLEWPDGKNVSMAAVFGIDAAVDIGNDDCVHLALQFSTQWDSLAHIGALFDTDGDGIAERRFYNGFHSDDLFAGAPDEGVRALGIENMAATCVQGRGVLVNLFKALGTTGTTVGHDLFQSILAEQGVVIEPGDILCLYTGFGDLVMTGCTDSWAQEGSYAALDGHDTRLLQWISDSGIAAICADNSSVEAKPPHDHAGHPCCGPDSSVFPLHHHCLFKLGLHLGELFYFGELAEKLDSQQRSRFLFTAPPLRLPGAVGSPMMPVATV